MPIPQKRRRTREIKIGKVPVGGNAPISVQSMTNTDTRDVQATVHQIQRLQEAGCEVIRIAVPDLAAAEQLPKIKRQISIPLIADIHFDFRLAILAAQNGADALRINPGNIGTDHKVEQVVQAAQDHGLSIRVGVNAGSLEKDILKEFGSATPQAMVKSALRHIERLEVFGQKDIKISLKASDVPRTVQAYRLLSEVCDLPFHIGVTEAGGLYPGIVKSALGIGMLLADGIGDTLRVSLTRDPVEEVRVGYEILKALQLRQRGPEIISCPTCGRCEIDLFRILDEVEKALLTKTTPIKIAIMGCVVNGPGEAKEADVGIAGGRQNGVLFKNGKVVAKLPSDQLVSALLAAVAEFKEEEASQTARSDV